MSHVVAHEALQGSLVTCSMLKVRSRLVVKNKPMPPALGGYHC